MKHGSIYLQFGFWKNIKAAGKNIFGPNAWELFCALRSSQLRAEVPIELFGQDDFLSILWHESGGSCFIEDGQIDGIIRNKLSIDILSSVFLLDKSEKECNTIAKRNGILCLNADMMLRKKYLVTGHGFSYDFHQKGNYSDMKDFFQLPCNSLLLIDPYILNKDDYIKFHIKPLLINILPEEISIPFHISIFSGIGKCNDDKLGALFYDKINQMLKEIRPNLNCSLMLYQIPIQGEGWHDRYILTNNIMINATAGFDFFGPVKGVTCAKKIGSFKLSCPLLDKNNETDIYQIWINKTSQESRRKNDNDYHHKRWGTQVNRLFELSAELNEGSKMSSM